MKFKKQVTTQLIGSVVLMASQWLISVLLVHLGSFRDAGIFSLAMSMANVFAAIADCGIRSYQISDTRKEFSREGYVFARLCTIMLSFLMCSGYLLLETGAYSLQEQFAILIYLLYLNISSLSDIHFGALQMRGKLHVNGFSNIMRGILGATAFFAVYILTHVMTFALFAMALNALIIFVLYDYRHYYKEFGYLGVPRKRDFSSAFCIVRKCIPLMLVSLCSFVLTAIPRRTINVVLGNEALGYFSSLFAPAALISTIGASAVYAIVPQTAERWKENDIKAFVKLAGTCYVGTFIFIGLAEICAILFGRPLIRLIFGEKIMAYYEILYLAIVSYGLSTMSLSGNSLLLSLRKVKALLFIGVVGVLFMVSVARVLILQIGIAGAAIALIFAYVVQCILHLCVVSIEVKRRFYR